VEDGREIFDDDLIDHDEDADRKKPKSKKEKAAKKAEKETQRTNFQNVRDMLSAMPAKRKRSEASSLPTDTPQLTGDDLLGDLLKELHEDKNKKQKISTQPNFLQGAIHPDDNDEVVEVPRTTPKRLIRVKSVVPKKKFVPFGSVKTEPSPCPSTPYSCSYGDPVDNNYDYEDPGSMDTYEYDAPAEPKKSTTSNGHKPKPLATSTVKADAPLAPPPAVIVPEKPKPLPAPAAPKVERNLKLIENFESFGHISNGNGIKETDEDATKFIEEGDTKDSKVKKKEF